MSRKKNSSLNSIIIILIIALISVIIYSNQESIFDSQIQPARNNDSFSNNVNSQEKDTNASIEVLFCPEDRCYDRLISLIEKSSKINCSIYEIDIGEVYHKLNEKLKSGSEVRITTDDDTYIHSQVELGDYNSDAKALLDANTIVSDNSSGYMHNKFCIFDSNLLWVGSFNFIKNDINSNNNNVILTSDKELISEFEDEFNEQWGGVFNKGSKSADIDGLNEAYFCPEDDCVGAYVNEISKAKSSVSCMFFAFTEDTISKELIQAKDRGVLVRLIFESSQAGSEYSKIHDLNKAGLDVIKDKNPKIMHNKFCVIDSDVVVTGSMNPSKRSSTLNDESIVVLNNSKIASKYVDYFNKYYLMWD